MVQVLVFLGFLSFFDSVLAFLAWVFAFLAEVFAGVVASPSWLGLVLVFGSSGVVLDYSC